MLIQNHSYRQIFPSFLEEKKLYTKGAFIFLDKGKWATTENSYLPQTCFQTVYS